MKYKTSRLAGGFVLFCIEIKLSAKVEGSFPCLWPCEFRKWLKTASAGGAHLKLLLVKVGTIFLCLRRYYFSFKRDFWRRRKCPRRVLHEGGLSSPKQSPQKCLTGFCYLTGLLVETKKLLTTDISNSVFISSWR